VTAACWLVAVTCSDEARQQPQTLCCSDNTCLSLTALLLLAFDDKPGAFEQWSEKQRRAPSESSAAQSPRLLAWPLYGMPATPATNETAAIALGINELAVRSCAVQSSMAVLRRHPKFKGVVCALWRVCHLLALPLKLCRYTNVLQCCIMLMSAVLNNPYFPFMKQASSAVDHAGGGDN
jgi:hypothetical protein